VAPEANSASGLTAGSRQLVEPAGVTLLATWSGHSDWILSLVFSSDSQYLYSSGKDGRVLRWQRNQPQAAEITRVPHAVHSLSLSTQRQLLAVGGFHHQVGLWDLAAGTWRGHFSCSCNDQRCVRFSPSGDRLLSGGRDGMVHIWDTTTGEQLAALPLHQDRVHTASFSADGHVVTSTGDDRRLVRYDLLAEDWVLEQRLKGSKLRAMCLVNDYLIAVAGADNTIRIFDVLLEEELGQLTGHTGSVAVMASAGEFLVSGAFDTTVRLWHLETELHTRPGVTKPVGLAPLDVDRKIDIR
jgi:WD40 repeat protein